MTSVPFTSLQPRCLLSFRKRSVDVLEEWIMVNGKPTKIMPDNGKQFTASIFKRFLEHNNTKDKPFPKSRKSRSI